MARLGREGFYTVGFLPGMPAQSENHFLLTLRQKFYSSDKIVFLKSVVLTDVHPQPNLVIRGPVLLLVGPLGSFFARFSRYLESQGVEVYKLSLPLHEFGFSERQRLPFSKPMEHFRPFLADQIERLGIQHLFMYGDFIHPHRIAIDLCADLRQQGHLIDSYVFELGYLRPNYVTLEPDRVNCLSNLNQPSSFYKALPDVDWFPQARRDSGLRWRKFWKSITFIQHAFTRYELIEGVHKLQPKPEFLVAQVRGLLRKYLYRFSEASIRSQLSNGKPFFLVVLQVATDSQLARGCSYESVEEFITDVVESFARNASNQACLFLKHHPRDRGYNHYGAHVRLLEKKFGLTGRLFYFHDSPLAPIFNQPSCCGVVLINSSVGFQALFHGVPLKALGQSAFNIDGLADQQTLDDFWQQPQCSDRDLFRRFYHHVLGTTQINGNFDGRFPFREVFPVKGASEQTIHSRSISARQCVIRILHLTRAGLLWPVAQLVRSKFLKQRAAGLALRGLGVRVCFDRRDHQPSGRVEVHLIPRNSFLEELAHCSCIGFSQSAYMVNLLALNSSISTQLKPSLRLAYRRGGVLIPWLLSSPNQPLRELPFLNSPCRLFWARLTGPEIFLECKESDGIDAALVSMSTAEQNLLRLYSIVP